MSEMVRLEDVGMIITGNTPKTSDKENYSSKDIPFIKPSDISETEITPIKFSEYFISEQARNKARILPTNSILVTCIGIIGKIGISKTECAFNQQINAIIPDLSKCIPEYLAYAIYSRKEILQNMANAPVVPILNKSQFSNIEIPLPPLPEQRRIAAVLDKVSELIALRKRQLDLLDEMVKARFVEMFGDISESEFCSIYDVCNLITDGTHNPPRFVENGIPFLLVSNIRENRITYDTQKFITPETYDQLMKRTPIEKGDILLSTVGSYGHPAIVISDKKFSFQRHIALLKPNQDKINSVFFHSAILSNEVQRQIGSLVLGVAQKTLNLSAIKTLRIPLPHISDQSQFADFVQQVDKSKATVQQGLDRLNLLKSALMQEYFG